MRLVVIGVNHKTAPVALRERLAFVGDDVIAALIELKTMTDGCVIVSTCNRTEIYALMPADSGVVIDYEAAIFQIKSWLADFKGVALGDIDPFLYVHQNLHALTHWLRVASGLDSMILGEPQILGQIKKAVQLAQSQKALSSQLSWVIDQVFAAAKRVRSETQVGAQAVSLGFAAAKLVTQIFDELPSRTLLVVAAGEMNRLVATHIAGLGVGRIIICNRSPDRAHALAAELTAPNRVVEVYPLSELPAVLGQADIVSSCSGSMEVLINKSITVAALKRRRYQPILMVDLAVPRDIDPDLGRMDDIYLYSVDDLQHVIAGNLEQRRQAAVDAELLVSQLVVEMERRFQVRQVGRDIQAYRARSQSQVAALLSEAIANLDSGEKSAEEVITEMSRRLTQTLGHAPAKLMQKAAREGDSALLDFVVSGLLEAYRPPK